MILSHHLIILLLKNVVQLQEDWLFKTGIDLVSLSLQQYPLLFKTFKWCHHYDYLWNIVGAESGKNY